MNFITSKVSTGNFQLPKIRPNSMFFERIFYSQVALLILHKCACHERFSIVPQRGNIDLVSDNKYF